MKQTVKPDEQPFPHPHQIHLDAQRRGRVQEGVAIGLAIIVLIATFVVAGLSVVDGTVPSASRTERSDAIPPTVAGEDCLGDGLVIVDDPAAGDRVCPFGS